MHWDITVVRIIAEILYLVGSMLGLLCVYFSFGIQITLALWQNLSPVNIFQLLVLLYTEQSAFSTSKRNWKLIKGVLLARGSTKNRNRNSQL
jgi:hypothetical protein